jgi:hypothetical protein
MTPIDLEARATLAGAKADLQRQRHEQRQRDPGLRFSKPIKRVQRTYTPPPDSGFVIATGADFFGHVDERIARTTAAIYKNVANAIDMLIDRLHESVQRALDARDREIKLLRDEVAVARGLAKLKAEVKQARRQAPDFTAELANLRKEAARQERIIRRLLGEQCLLDFGLRQTEKRMTATTRELTDVGTATREVLARLQADGFDIVGGMQ